MQTLLAAIKSLTLWGCISASPSSPKTVEKGAAYFPLVGLIVGLLLAVSNHVLASHLQPEILNIVILALWISATGAMHLKGLKATFDAFEKQDSRPNGTWGITALLIVIFLKSAALNSMDEMLTLSLLLSPLFARWAALLFFFGYNTRFDEATRGIAQHISIWPVLASTAATLGLAFYFLGRKGLWITLILSLFTLSLRALLHRGQPLLSNSNVDAVVELTEGLSLILLASL